MGTRVPGETASILPQAMRACFSKVPYWTKATAEEARTRAQRLSGKPLKVYRCEYGAHWHLATRRNVRG